MFNHSKRKKVNGKFYVFSKCLTKRYLPKEKRKEKNITFVASNMNKFFTFGLLLIVLLIGNTPLQAQTSNSPDKTVAWTPIEKVKSFKDTFSFYKKSSLLPYVKKNSEGTYIHAELGYTLNGKDTVEHRNTANLQSNHPVAFTVSHCKAFKQKDSSYRVHFLSPSAQSTASLALFMSVDSFYFAVFPSVSENKKGFICEISFTKQKLVMPKKSFAENKALMGYVELIYEISYVPIQGNAPKESKQYTWSGYFKTEAL